MLIHLTTSRALLLIAVLFTLNFKTRAFTVLNDTERALTVSLLHKFTRMPLATVTIASKEGMFLEDRRFRYNNSSEIQIRETASLSLFPVIHSIDEYTQEQLLNRSTVFTLISIDDKIEVICNLKGNKKKEEALSEKRSGLSVLRQAENLFEQHLLRNERWRNIKISSAVIAGLTLTYKILAYLFKTKSSHARTK